MSNRETALLFPGQAAQHVGMGVELRELSDGAERLLRAAENNTGLPLGPLCSSGPLDRLTETSVAQPAVVTTSLMAWEALVAGMPEEALEQTVGWCAGHSVGEYAALVAAGALEVEQALALVAERARLMAQACERVDGTMVAVLGLDETTLVAVCKRASADTGHMVQIANLNAPEQIVISGQRQAVDEASRLARAAGARRCLPLNVAGPFHSEYMRPAAEAFAPMVAALDLRRPRFPIALNQTAQPTTDVTEIRRELVEQIWSAVRWSETLQRMAALGGKRFIELGPGTVLTGLARRTLEEAVVLNVEDRPSLNKTLAALRAEQVQTLPVGRAVGQPEA